MAKINLGKKPKIILIILAALLLVGLIIFFVVRQGNSNPTIDDQTSTTTSKKQSLDQEQKPIITLTSQNGGRELILAVQTQKSFAADEVEYELIYYLEDNLSRGMSGAIEMANDYGEIEILLGTCSSGTCRYDDGVVGGQVIISLSQASKLYSLEADFAFLNEDTPFEDEEAGLTITTQEADNLLVLAGGGLANLPDQEIIAGPYSLTGEGTTQASLSFDISQGQLLVEEDGTWSPVPSLEDLPLGIYLLVESL